MRFNFVYFFPLVLLLFSVYSYSQVDPNLVFSGNQIYWSFQQWMWQLGYHHRLISSIVFGSLILSLFALYFTLLGQIVQHKISSRQLVLLLGLSLTALLPAFPGLSHDVFSYLFNGKIVVYYHSNPYLHSPWDFPGDPWLWFTHNLEARTPYGIVWTGLSALIYLATAGDLQVGMFGFRVLSVAAVLVTGWAIGTVTGKGWRAAAWFLFNPLVLIEAVGNMHNDMVMMAFFIGGLAIGHKIPIVAGWILSIFTKLITIVAPLAYIGHRILRRWITVDTYGLMALGFILLQYFDGSHRFYSWYLLWPLSVAALSNNRYIQELVVCFSITGMGSYLFYLLTGTYTADQLVYRLLFLFSLPVLYTGYKIVRAWK